MLKKRFKVVAFKDDKCREMMIQYYGVAESMVELYKNNGYDVFMVENALCDTQRIIDFFRSMSSGLIGSLIGETKYAIIDAYIENAEKYIRKNNIYNEQGKIDVELLANILLEANGRVE